MIPSHPYAQFTRANQLDESFTLISSDDAMERNSFEDIFGAELPFVKADYPMFFIFQTEDMTVVYGSEHVRVMADEPIDLLYFWSMDTIKEGAYCPYAGSALESVQTWEHEIDDNVSDQFVWASGFIPFATRFLHGDYLVGYTLEQDERLVLKYGTEYWLFEMDDILSPDYGYKSFPFMRGGYSHNLLIIQAQKWGIK